MDTFIPIWSIWTIFGLVFVIAEIFTSGFAVLCFSFGCAAAAVCAALDIEIAWQIAAFAIGSGLAFVTVRPMVLRYLMPEQKQVRTNASALVGRVVRVTETIDESANTGAISVDGSEWRAVADTLIPKGEKVEIVGINSTILTVKPC